KITTRYGTQFTANHHTSVFCHRPDQTASEFDAQEIDTGSQYLAGATNIKMQRHALLCIEGIIDAAQGPGVAWIQQARVTTTSAVIQIIVLKLKLQIRLVAAQ